MNLWGWARSSRLAAWLAAGICLSVSLLAWFGFRASQEFHRSSGLLVQRRADEAARLLVTALVRDMRAAQSSVLSSTTWDDFGPDSSHEVTALVASAFARYPYPEAFLVWDAGTPDAQLMFYIRSDRPPAWASPPSGLNRYPVRTLQEPVVAAEVLAPVRRDAAAGRPFSIAELPIGGSPYQVVVLLRYKDRLRQHLASARGFMVNLPWVRQHYFSELTKQVGQIGGENPGLLLAVTDERGDSVVGQPKFAGSTFVSRRGFPLAFFDPDLLAMSRPAALVPRTWMVSVNAASDPTLGVALFGADLTLGIAAAAAVVLALGLGVAARAMRSSTELAEMRADFMASVTHELKTPIASIQAMGETLTRGRLREPKAQQEYAAAVVHEAKRLARLVDNVLAHSRVTDVADVYSFEPVGIEDLVGAALVGFTHQLEREHYVVSVEIPPDVPPILADRVAMELLLGNLIDNAIRHSGETKELRIAVEACGRHVCVTLSDRGLGIPPEDLGRVTQKFVRGRNAGAGGSGLGLAIVDRIVRDHGGTFTIDSSLGHGTTIRVVVPAAEEERIHRAATLSQARL
jgi:signal transduction histidine kinase